METGRTGRRTRKQPQRGQHHRAPHETAVVQIRGGDPSTRRRVAGSASRRRGDTRPDRRPSRRCDRRCRPGTRSRAGSRPIWPWRWPGPENGPIEARGAARDAACPRPDRRWIRHSSKALYVMGVTKRLDRRLRRRARCAARGPAVHRRPVRSCRSPPDENADGDRIDACSMLGKVTTGGSRTARDSALALSRQLQVTAAPDRADIVAALRRVKSR